MNALSFGRPNSLRSGVVVNPELWESACGYEFWFVAQEDLAAVMGAANGGLDGNGWTRASTSAANGVGGDFLSASDVDPTRIGASAGGGHLVSPNIFGSYDHALQAARFLGYFPTKLTAEFFARFSTANTDTATTFFGFGIRTLTDASAAGSAACIRIGATTFVLESDSATDNGAARDTAWHLFKIEVTASTTEWFIDGVSQGTISTQADVWPVSFLMYRGGVGNVTDIATLKVFYS